MSKLDADIEDLTSAEDFLNYFQVNYDAQLIKTKRIQLMRLFHSILNRKGSLSNYTHYKCALEIAYRQLTKGVELEYASIGCDGCTSCDSEE